MSTSIILIPQAKDIFMYDDNFNLQASIPEGQYTEFMSMTCAASRAGGVYIMQLNIPNNTTRVKYFDFSSNTVTKTLTSPARYGDELGVHSFWELPDRTLLTIDVNTRHLVQLSSTDLSVIRTYSLVVNPLDGWISPDGTKLAYMVGNVLKQWDLVADTSLSDIKDFGQPCIMPVWLSNNSIIVYTGLYDATIGNVRHIDAATGNEYVGFGGFSFTEGVHGICASVVLDRLYILGVDEYGGNGDIFVCEEYVFDATHVGRQIIIGPMQTWFPSFELSAGWIHIYESPITSVTIDCNTLIMTITGTGFPDNPTVQMTLNGQSFTGFTIQSTSPTVITVLMPGFNDGNYQVSVS